MIMSKSRNSFSLLHREMKKLEKSKKPDYSSAKKSAPSTSTASTSRYGKKKTSKDKMKEKNEIDPNVPDRSYGDLYCKICDSHMNSQGMWTAHITGKRHIKNVKKGDRDTKYEDLKVESTANPDLKKMTDAVIGLSYVHEIRKLGSDAPQYFNCFLCSVISFSVPSLREHVVCYKHRLNYMKEQYPEEYEIIEGTNLKKGHMEPLVQEKAIELEKKDGRGEIKVKQEKPKMIVPFGKRYRSSSEDSEDYQKPSKSYKNDKGDVWKSVDTSKMCDAKSERSYKDRKRDSCDSDDDNIVVLKDSYKESMPMRKKISGGQNDPHSRSMPLRREISPGQNDSYSRHVPMRREISPSRSDSYSRPAPTRREISPGRSDSYSRPASTRREISPGRSDSHSRQAPMRREISPGRSNSHSRPASMRREISPGRSDSHSRPAPMRRERSPGRSDSFSRSAPTRREISPERNNSYSRSVKKSLDTDDYPRHSDYDKYSRHTDLDRKHQSPGYESIKYEERQNSNYNSARSSSRECQSHAGPRQRESNLLPHEISTNEKSMSENDSIEMLVKTMFELPLSYFSKIVLGRLENEEINDPKELSILISFVKRSNEILTNKITALTQMRQGSQNNVSGSNAESTVTALPSRVVSSGVISQPTNTPNHQSQPIFNPMLSEFLGYSATNQATSLQSVNTNASSQQYVNSYQSSSTNYPSTSNYSNTSTNNNTFPSSLYDNSQIYTSSGIPGLTLTQNENPDPSYNNYLYQC